MGSKNVLIEDLSEDQLAQEIGEASLSDMQKKKKKQMSKSSFFPLTQKTPWLVFFADGKKDEAHTFYSLEENKFRVENTVRQLDRREVHSCSHEWLIAEDLDSKEFILLNPISMEQINIPPPPPLPQPEMHKLEIYKSCNITAPPTDQDCLLFLCMEGCPFMKVYHLLEKKWYVWELDIKGPERGLRNVVVFNGCIFAVVDCELLVRVIFHHCKPTIGYLNMEIPNYPFLVCCWTQHWIASGGELYFVRIFQKVSPLNTEGLNVSKINFSEMRWEVVNNIGDQIFFLNVDCKGVSCSAHETKLTRNCIYYLSEDGYLNEYNVANREITLLRSFHWLKDAAYFWVLPKMDGEYTRHVGSEKNILKDCEKIEQKCYNDNAWVTSTRLSRQETKEEMVALDTYTSQLEENALAKLFPDIVRLIVHRLSYLDTQCIGNAIPAWLPIIREIPKPLGNWSTGSPCLLSFSNDFKRCCLIDQLRDMTHIIWSPELPCRIEILYSKHGWLLLLATSDSFTKTDDLSRAIHDYFIFFYNPLSKAIIKLPPPECIIKYSFSFSSPPTSSNCVVIGVNFEGDEIVICRKGDSEWIEEMYAGEDGEEILRNEFTTPVFLKGEFHILMRDGKIGLFNPVTLSLGLCCESKMINPETHRHHLVESNDELFWVVATKTGDSIHVYKLDRSDYKWKEVESLEGKCFFVGPCSSVSASTLGAEKDMIYFPMSQDGHLVGYSCAEQRSFPKENFYGAHELLLGSCWIEPRWTQHTIEELMWF
ncbi:hypothetical protein LUZ60_014239 [Juncus effusus]|nr:hypothetical protein LUZ60_014239 [Juncus effusus]